MSEVLYEVDMLWNQFRNIETFSNLTKRCYLDYSFEVQSDVLTRYDIGIVTGAWCMFLNYTGYKIGGVRCSQ